MLPFSRYGVVVMTTSSSFLRNADNLTISYNIFVRTSQGRFPGTIWPMVRLKVKEVLQEKHMSIGKLSRRSDVAWITISRMCNQPTTYSPTLDTLDRIAKALNVPISELYEEIDS